MNMMGEKRDMFEALGCDGEIENLGEPHIPFNPSPSVKEMREVLEINFVMTMS
jgi:hypothetical protein